MFCPRKYGVEVLTLYLVDCCECCTEFLNIDIDTFYSFPLKYNILRKTLLGYAFMAYAFNTLGIFVNSTESSPPKMWRIGYLVHPLPMEKTHLMSKLRNSVLHLSHPRMQCTQPSTCENR